MTKLLLPILAVLVVAGGAYLLTRERPETPSATDDPAPPAASEMRPEPAASAPTTAPSSATPPVPIRDAGRSFAPVAPSPDPAVMRKVVLYPDGTFRPVLNGAYGAPPILWPTERPYSPIVDLVKIADGTEWYLHADGSASTTRMVWRSDIGREDAFSQVNAKLPDVAPMDPGAPLETGGK